MALDPTDDEVQISLNSALGGGMSGTDTFTVEYSTDGGSTFDTAGKNQNTSDFVNVQFNDVTYGLFNAPINAWVNDAGTPTIVRVRVQSGLCSGTTDDNTI